MTLQTFRLPGGAWWRHTVSLWGRMVRMGRRAPKRLRLCESLPLGERRFVAVIEFEQSRFLVGGTASTLVMLARLGKPGRASENARGDDLHKDDLRINDSLAQQTGDPN
jgi:flagellar biogenesis protein FliO